jgi:plasmid maintenance system antidote protein VapI
MPMKAFGGEADAWFRLQSAYSLAQAMTKNGGVKGFPCIENVLDLFDD